MEELGLAVNKADKNTHKEPCEDLKRDNMSKHLHTNVSSKVVGSYISLHAYGSANVNVFVDSVSAMCCIDFPVSSPDITENSSNKGIIFPL